MVQVTCREELNIQGEECEESIISVVHNWNGWIYSFMFIIPRKTSNSTNGR